MWAVSLISFMRKLMVGGVAEYRFIITLRKHVRGSVLTRRDEVRIRRRRKESGRKGEWKGRKVERGEGEGRKQLRKEERKR